MQPNVRILILACSTTVMAQLGVTLYLPATPYIVNALGMSAAEGYNALLMYLSGAAVPLTFTAHLIRLFGRSAVLWVFCCMFFCGSFLSVWAYDDKSFYFSRLLQGLGGGGAALLGRALLSQVFSGAHLARNLSLLSYSFVFALVAGQVASGFLVSFYRWEVVAVVMACGSIISAILVLPVREILSALDIDSQQRVRRPRYAAMVSHPSFYLPVILGGCGYGVFVVYQGVGVYVFDALLEWDSAQYGMFGVWLGLAYFAGALSVRYALRSVSISALSIMAGGVLLFAVSIFFLTTLKHLDRNFVFLAYLAVWYAQAMIYPCVASMAVKKYPGIEAMMLFSFLQQLVALLFGALASLLIAVGMHGVALLTLGLGALGALVTVLLSNNSSS
ncbi:DHA1 family bicyclomycin/chloramphenicol resistance-like MFS transporter [Pseudomonas synxantha]|nr:DHA1 family bicyclomycin/chloramphenicol resistance-like MFS transporter [Pseudomonas synxantha]